MALPEERLRVAPIDRTAAVALAAIGAATWGGARAAARVTPR